MLKLGVNIDHVATLRQARYRDAEHARMVPEPEPDPALAAAAAAGAGAHSITVHLREDRRHIQDADLPRLREMVKIPLNLEMAVTPEMLAFALKFHPEEVCLVPENRLEVTTEGGLDVAGQENRVGPMIRQLKEAGILVSLFIDPDPRQIASAHKLGAPCIELHTGSFANAGARQTDSLQTLTAAAVQAHHLGLQVNAGHGLNYENLPLFLQTPHLDTLNIGHSIISRAVFTGLPLAVSGMLALMQPYGK